MLTNRDRQYLRAIFLLKGNFQPVGPSTLSRFIDVSKEAAFQEMRRLEFLGFGKYTPKEGLTLNKKAISIIENDVKRHHVLEKFFKKSLNMTHEEACEESTNIDPYVSERLMNNISDKIGFFEICDCGCPINSPLEIKDLKKCNWIKKNLLTKEG